MAPRYSEGERSQRYLGGSRAGRESRLTMAMNLPSHERREMGWGEEERESKRVEGGHGLNRQGIQGPEEGEGKPVSRRSLGWGRVRRATGTQGAGGQHGLLIDTTVDISPVSFGPDNCLLSNADFIPSRKKTILFCFVIPACLSFIIVMYFERHIFILTN